MAQKRYQSQRQEEPDPVEQAMQLYQMFSAPQQNQGLDIIKLIESENRANFQDQELQLAQQEQQEQIRMAQEKNDLMSRDVATREAIANQKAELTPEQLLFFSDSLTNPKTSPAQRAVLKRILPPELVADIEAQRQAQIGALGLDGQPVQGAAGTQEPVALSNPLAFGSNLGDQARQALGMEPNTEPFGFMNLFKKLFAPKPVSAVGQGQSYQQTQPLPY